MKEKVSILEKLGIHPGLKTIHMKTVTEADIALFAGVSGDFNPVHVCEEYAKKTFFNSRIAHGALAQAYLSAAMAKLPGLVIYLSQLVNFQKPIRIGDTITAMAEVVETREEKGIVKLKNTCLNQKGEVVVEGEATVRIYEPPS